MKTIYVVRGDAGEFEDYREWSVRAYATEAAAQNAADGMNQIVKAVRKLKGVTKISQRYVELTRLANYGESADVIRYFDNSTQYSVVALDLED